MGGEFVRVYAACLSFAKLRVRNNKPAFVVVFPSQERKRVQLISKGRIFHHAEEEHQAFGSHNKVSSPSSQWADEGKEIGCSFSFRKRC
jgi:hypothetical protein